MARISAEAQSAAIFRSGNNPMPAPEHLSDDAKVLWQEIVASKPADRFDAGSGPLLEMFVTFAVHSRWLMERMRKVKVTDPAAAQMERRLGAMTKVLAMLAGKLRLSVSSKIDRRSGELDEPGTGDIRKDRLLGGAAFNRRGN